MPLNGNNNSNDGGVLEPEVVHHLKDNKNIYENSFDEDGPERKADSNAAS